MRALVVLFSVLFIACSSTPDQLSGSELIKWIENPENGYKKIATTGSVEYLLQKRPVDYIIALEFKQNRPMREMVEARRNELNGLQYFSLRLQSEKKDKDVMTEGINSMEDYLIRNSYYSYSFQEDLQLLDGNDTLRCNLYHFVNSNGISPYVEFVFAFNKSDSELNKNYKVIINDKAMASKPMVFDFEKLSSPSILTQ